MQAVDAATTAAACDRKIGKFARVHGAAALCNSETLLVTGRGMKQRSAPYQEWLRRWRRRRRLARSATEADANEALARAEVVAGALQLLAAG